MDIDTNMQWNSFNSLLYIYGARVMILNKYSCNISHNKKLIKL